MRSLRCSSLAHCCEEPRRVCSPCAQLTCVSSCSPCEMPTPRVCRAQGIEQRCCQLSSRNAGRGLPSLLRLSVLSVSASTASEVCLSGDTGVPARGRAQDASARRVFRSLHAAEACHHAVDWLHVPRAFAASASLTTRCTACIRYPLAPEGWREGERCCARDYSAVMVDVVG